MTEVSNSMMQCAGNSGNCAELTYKNLTGVKLYLKILLSTQHEVSFMKTSEVTRKVDWPNREWQMYKMSETVFNWPQFTLSPLSYGENGFSNDALSPPEAQFIPQNLQMLFSFNVSLVFFLFNKPLCESLTIQGLKIFFQCSPPAMKTASPILIGNRTNSSVNLITIKQWMEMQKKQLL